MSLSQWYHDHFVESQWLKTGVSNLNRHCERQKTLLWNVNVLERQCGKEEEEDEEEEEDA